MTEALFVSMGPSRVSARNDLVSAGVNRLTRRRRTTPMRSMSAIRFTASVTSANSSGRIAKSNRIGFVAFARTT